MTYCPECGVEVEEEEKFCGDCGADMTTGKDSKDESFIDRYGAKPLPFASGRGEFSQLYGKLLGAIPIFGGLVKSFAGFNFWCYAIWLKILNIITLDADVTQRFISDFNYIKDSFYSGYDGKDAPPNPP